MQASFVARNMWMHRVMPRRRSFLLPTAFQQNSCLLPFQRTPPATLTILMWPDDGDGAIEPVREEVCSVAGRSREQEDKWRTNGLKAIAQGKLAALLLAGGQVRETAWTC